MLAIFINDNEKKLMLENIKDIHNQIKDDKVIEALNFNDKN